jgi:hypothetical protein
MSSTTQGTSAQCQPNLSWFTFEKIKNRHA